MAANKSSIAPTSASTCTPGACAPRLGQRSVGSLLRSDTSAVNDSSHFWHCKSSCMSPDLHCGRSRRQHSHSGRQGKRCLLGIARLTQRIAPAPRSPVLLWSRPPPSPAKGMAMASAAPKIPSGGEPITLRDGRLQVPDRPIVPFIEGDGTGPDIWRSSQRVFDAAVDKAYGGKRRIAWTEVFAGDKSKQLFDSWLPDETVDAF